MTCFLGGGSNYNRRCEGRNELILSVMVELFFLCVFVLGVEIDLVFGCGPLIAPLGFSVSIKMNLVFVWVVDIDLNSV